MNQIKITQRSVFFLLNFQSNQQISISYPFFFLFSKLKINQEPTFLYIYFCSSNRQSTKHKLGFFYANNQQTKKTQERGFAFKLVETKA
jgi:hypothetical protein